MTMRKGKVFLKNTKQTEQDNPCLWFPPFFYFAFRKNPAVTFWRPCQDLSMWGFIRLYTFAKDVYMCSQNMKASNVQLSLARGLDTCADDSFILVRTDLHLEWKYCSDACCSL